MHRFSSPLQTLSITLFITLTLTLSLRAQTSPWPYGPLGAATEEAEKHEEYDPEKNPWWKMSPEGYARAIDYLMGMRDERDVEWARGKDDVHLMANNRWTAINPNKAFTRGSITSDGWMGRIRTLRWVYSSTARDMQAIAGASSGGLWVGEEDGSGRRYWRSIGDNLPNPSVGAFMVNPYNSNDIWVGTGDWGRAGGAGLYRTTDRGLSWTRYTLSVGGGGIEIPSACTAIFYDIIPTSRGTITDTTTMYLATDKGLFKTVDRGTTWNRMPIIGRRSDSASWAIYTMVRPEGQRGTFYAALPYGGGVFKTVDGGTSWTPMNNGLPMTNVGATLALDVSMLNSQILYASFGDTVNNGRGVWKTIDGGANWTRTASNGAYMNNNQGFHAHCIKIHPTNPDIVYVGSVALSKTTNGGTSWNNVDGGHADYVMIGFHPSDANLVYLCNDGGIFVRNESANSVSNAREAFIPAAPIQAYGMDYAWGEPGMTIVGTQDNGTLRTLNAGAGIWEIITGCDGPDNIAIDPRNAAVAFFNGWCGPGSFPRWRVLDRGNTAPRNVSNGVGELWMTPIQINKLNTNYPFTVDTAFLYYTTNNGENWVRGTSSSTRDFTSMQLPRGLAMSVGGSSTVTAYVNFWPQGRPPFPFNSSSRTILIAEGTPGNMTWITSQLPGVEIVRRVITDRWDPDRAYAFTDDPAPYAIYRTTDRGRSWRPITGDLPRSVKHWDIERPGPGSTTMYVATDVGIFKTRDDGVTWYKYQYGLPIVGVGNIDYIPSVTGVERHDTLRLASFGRGMWQRVLQWEDPLWNTIQIMIDSTVLRNLILRQIRPVISPGNIYGVGLLLALADSGLIYRTINGGLGWSRIQAPTQETLHASASPDGKTSVAVGDLGTIVRSVDGGESWYPIQGPSSATLRTISFGDALHGVIGGDDGTILTTADGGESWYSQGKETAGLSILSVHMLDAWNGWLTGADHSQKPPTPVFRRTTDGGDSWFDDVAPHTEPIERILFVDTKTGFAVGANGWIGKTSDNGNSWQTKKSPAQVPLHDIAFVTADSGWAVGDNGTILFTSDGGETWEFDESGTDEHLKSLALSDSGLVAVGDSTILVRLRTATRTLDVATNTGSSSAVRLTAHPNPSHGIVTLSFTLPSTGHVKLEIFDAMGRRVATLVDGALAAGAYSRDWGGRGADDALLPAGSYYCRLTTSSGVTVEQVVIAR